MFTARWCSSRPGPQWLAPHSRILPGAGPGLAYHPFSSPVGPSARSPVLLVYVPLFFSCFHFYPFSPSLSFCFSLSLFPSVHILFPVFHLSHLFCHSCIIAFGLGLGLGLSLSLGLGLGLLFSSQPEKLLTTKHVDHLKSIQVFGWGHRVQVATPNVPIMGCPCGQSAHVDRQGFFGTWWFEDATQMSFADAVLERCCVVCFVSVWV